MKSFAEQIAAVEATLVAQNDALSQLEESAHQGRGGDVDASYLKQINELVDEPLPSAVRGSSSAELPTIFHRFA
jgi:hypothetical protein